MLLLRRFFSKEKKTTVKSKSEARKEEWIRKMLLTPRDFEGPFSLN